MDTQKRKESFWTKNYIYIFATGIPALIMLGVWIADKIGPGGHSLIIIDGLHQYMPFFSDYQDKLREGSSLFYSFQEGMGTNFLSLWSYYLASPLNLLILLFPKSGLNTAVSLIVSLKIVFCGWTFAYAALHRNKVQYRHPGVIPLAVAYAMSNYVIGYYWNVMWMDCIMIFPLIVLGFDYLVSKRDPRLYILTLFYALFCNYFIGFMICIFLVLWAVLYDYKNLREMGRTAWMFAGSSLLAGGLAGIVLVPAYMGIMNTASAKRTLPGWTQYGTLWNAIQAHLIGNEPINNQVDDSGVNLYCGMFALFLLFVYLFSKEFALREKIKYILILGFMLISYNTEILNYIWHGFHNQYGIPNRFSFLYIFLLLWIGYEVLLRYRRIGTVPMLLSGIFTTGITLLCYYQADEKLKTVFYILAIVLPIVYMILSLLYHHFEKAGKVWRIVLAAVMSLEMIGGAIYGWSCNGTIDTEYYFSDTEAIAHIRDELYAEDDGFYRMELGNTKMLDEPTWHGLRCLTLFGSTAQGSMVTAMGRLGFYTGANEYLYCGATPLTNALTSMKYVMYRDGDFNNNTMVYKTTYNGVSVYENPYCLPIGFCVSQDLAYYEPVSTYFEVQNGFAQAATGLDSQLFTVTEPIYTASGTGCTTTVKDNQITYVKDGVEKPTVQVSFLVEDNVDLYMDISGGNVRQVKLYLDGRQVADDRYQNQAFHLGALTQGQQVMLEFTFNTGGSDQDTITLHTAQFHNEVWDAVYEQLKKNPMDVTECRDGYIKGTVEADDMQMLFFSIPEDSGWSIYVDGEKAEHTPVMNAFMGVMLDAGSHTVELKYTSVGFWKGLILSLISLVILLTVWQIIRRYLKKWKESERSVTNQQKGAMYEEEDTKSSDSGSRTGDPVSAGNEGNSERDVTDC